MSEIKKDRCDVCGEETADRYAQKGWVHLDGDLTVHGGRMPDGCAAPDIAYHGASARAVDFCSVQCFVKYLQGYKSKSKSKEKKR